MHENPTRLAIISDTHGRDAWTRWVIPLLHEHAVDAVLHCGDIGSASVVRAVADWPAHYVFGNVDLFPGSIRKAIDECQATCHGLFAALQFGSTRVALLHGHERRRFQDTCSNGEFDVVCYGHTHKFEHHFEGDTLVINPGALHRAARKSIALLELPERHVEHCFEPL